MRSAGLALTIVLFSISALCFGSSPKQLAELTASDGAVGDDFGISVAVTGNTAVVGAAFATIGSLQNVGAAYVFAKPGSGTWTQVAKLTPSNGVSYQYFGYSVAISGNTIVVGCGGIFGGAYVFVKPADGWRDMNETAILGGGSQVAMSGNTIATGVWVYVKPKTGWVSDMLPTATLSEKQPQDDGFGASVAISGNTVVVGAIGQNYKLNGSAYVFVKPASGWTNITQTAKLTQSDGTSLDNFGFSVSVSGATIAVGARDKNSGLPYTGAAYVYVQPSGGWTDATETAELTNAAGNRDSQFGFSVAATTGRIVVGSPYGYGPNNEGAAYVYNQPKSGWVTTSQYSAQLLPSDAQAGNSFGISVAENGGFILVGASELPVAPGAAYIF